MIPRQPSSLRFDGPWKINGSREVRSLSEQGNSPSGGETATYEYAFNLSPEQSGLSARLDLGVVENGCEVTINDSPALSDHWPPYQLIVTGRLKQGENKLKIVVRNSPQPTLDKTFHESGPPVLRGPVVLKLWK
jgi:hypothetical protein